jgi:acyl carrier protein
MSSYEETLATTVEILKQHVDGARTIAPTDHIQHDLGLDSLGIMEVIADVEDRFDVSIPTDALTGISTVEDMARALFEETVKSKSPIKIGHS